MWVAYRFGIGAGVGLALVVLNLRGHWQNRRREASAYIGAEAERWLDVTRGDIFRIADGLLARR